MSSTNILFRSAMTLILVWSFYGSGYCQTEQSGQLRRAAALPKATFPAGKSFVEVPFEENANHIIIPVSVNGSRPLKFVLDTGAQSAILDNSAVADSLNLKITGKAQVRGAGSGQNAEVSVAQGITLEIGGLVLSDDFMAIRPPRQGLSPAGDRDGALGRSLFGSAVVEVDWERRIIRFYDPARFNYSGKGAVLPLTFDEGGRPYATAKVNISDNAMIPVKLVVDTGASTSLSLDVGSHPEIRYPEGAVKVVLGRGASGEITGYSGQIKSIELGGYAVKNVPTSFPDASEGTAGLGGRNGRLGAGVLRRFKIIYDYPHRQMIVEPNKFLSEWSAVSDKIAASKTIQVAPEKLLGYAGKYGNKEISVREGELYYQRVGGRGAALRATGNDKFVLSSDALITFSRDSGGTVTEMLIEWVERDKEQLKREALAENQSNSQPPNQPPLSQAEQEVRKLEREWLDAYEKRDAEAMERILAGDFKLTMPGGVQTKADILAQIKAAQNSQRPSPRFSTEETQSRVEGDKVILTGVFIQRMEMGGQTRTMKARYNDIYAKRDGRWQVIFSELTPIQPISQ